MFSNPCYSPGVAINGNFSLMSFGLFLGITHAMDADHIAAVSAM